MVSFPTSSELASSRRAQRISKIKEVISLCFSEGREISVKKMLVELSSVFNASHRTAREYLDVVIYEMKLAVEKGVIRPSPSEVQTEIRAETNTSGGLR